MRVTAQYAYSQSMTDITLAATELAARQREVSSGKKLNSPSDDPSGAASAVRERSELAGLDQYSETADNANSRLSVIDTVLADVLERLTQARTSILGARGTAVTPAQRDAAANDLAGIRDALASDLNTQFRGTFLFSGQAATVAPYQRQSNGTMSAYQGSTGNISVDLDAQTSVAISVRGDAITKGTDTADLFAEIENAITAVRAGDDAGMQSASQAITRAFSRATAAQSQAGTSMKSIETIQGRVSDLRLASNARLNGIENVDMAEAITRMNQADTSYQAALGAISRAGRVSLMDYLS